MTSAWGLRSGQRVSVAVGDRSMSSEKANISSGLVSIMERGHLEQVSLRAMRRVAAVLEIRLDISAWMPSGAVDRLLNAGHAALHEELARYLDRLPGWVHAPEVSFAIYRERGDIDILAFHPSTRSLLVIELKTEVVSLEDLLTTMDVRIRLARRIASERGWDPATVSAWVVIAESDANRRRAHAATLRSAFPADGHAVRRWLGKPAGSIRALSFGTNSNHAATKQRLGSRKRVRLP